MLGGNTFCIMVGVGQPVRTLPPSCVLSHLRNARVCGAVHVSPPIVIIHRFVSFSEQVGWFARMAGRVCVVIGVGPGLGMSCVRQWVKEGYKVCLNQFE